MHELSVKSISSFLGRLLAPPLVVLVFKPSQPLITFPKELENRGPTVMGMVGEVISFFGEYMYF